MSTIINEAFTVGERYEGLVNGEIIRVTDIHEPGTYTDRWGNPYELRFTTVWFESETTGRKACRDLRSAQRLLMKKVS